MLQVLYQNVQYSKYPLQKPSHTTDTLTRQTISGGISGQHELCGAEIIQQTKF